MLVMTQNWLAVSLLCAGGLIECHDELDFFKPKGLILAAYDDFLIRVCFAKHTGRRKWTGCCHVWNGVVIKQHCSSTERAKNNRSTVRLLT